MPKFTLTDEQIADIAAFLHTFRAAGYDESRMKPPSIVVGDAKAGEAFFKAKCASCHSTTGDLRGLATRIADPRLLQQTWLMPGSGGGRGAAPAGARAADDRHRDAAVRARRSKARSIASTTSSSR